MERQTRKKRKLKKGIKKRLLIVAIIILSILCINKYNKMIEQQHQEDLQNYYTCIIEQSKNNGYLIRSACSPFYSQYDKELKLKYKKIGYDLFLKEQ